MTVEIFLLWLIIWVIFLVMGAIEVRGPTFSFLAGIWIIFLGIYIYLSGLQFQSGMTMTVVGAVTTITNIYTEIVPPTPLSYQIMWCIPFIALGIYIIFLAMTKPHPNKQG